MISRGSQAATVHSMPKLLVIDDESIIRQRLQEIGEKQGFEVRMAADGVQGWASFKKDPPDLVILDIYMPRMNGLMVLSKIRELCPDCPVILITGFMHYEQLVHICSSAKPDGCIIKPLDVARITHLMLTLVHKKPAVKEWEVAVPC